MSSGSPSVPSEAGSSPKCLARSVADALAHEPTLEAVTVNRARKTISVATLGQVDVPRITERVSASIQCAREAAEPSCAILTGSGDCQTCAMPLSAAERRAITIRNEGDATTIARVTCPTAPRFWRWRDIPWPKVVQRDVEFLEHIEEEIDDWKPQLAAAILCGAFGLAAYLFGAHEQAR